MEKLRKNIATFLLAMILILSLANMANAGSPTPPSPPPLTEQEKIFQGKTLSFLTRVVGLNMSGYETVDAISSPSPSGVFVTFKFRSFESDLDVGTEFRNGELRWCMLYPVKGSPAFVSPASSDVLNIAKDTLDRLQAFSAKEYLPTMRSMLESVTELQSSKTSNADFTQEIAVKGNDVTISWAPFANGLTNQQNQLILEFKDGNLMFFADYLGMYKIGSSDVKISEQEAVQIAKERARAFSWVQDNETVSNVTVLDNPFIAKLSLQNRGNATLYPLWEIKLALDKMYPGGVTSFQVFIWADTGEVSSVKPIGVLGVHDAATESPTTNTLSTQEAPEYGLAIAIVLVAATIVILGYLRYKRKR